MDREGSIDGHIEVAKYLLDRGHSIEPTVERRRPSGEIVRTKASALWDASSSGISRWRSCSLPTAQTPVSLSMTKSGGSVVHAAVFGGHLEMVQLWLRHGADPTISNARGNPLSRGVERGKADIVRLLMRYGADTNGGNGYPDEVLLEDACIGGYVDIARQLIEAGAVVPAVDRKKIARHLAEIC